MQSSKRTILGREPFRPLVVMAAAIFLFLSLGGCVSPVQPPAGQGPQALINSPAAGSQVAGTFFLAVQPLDPSAVARVDFRAGSRDLGSDTTAADGFRVAVVARDHAAGTLELSATVTGTNGSSRTVTVTVENVPNPPANATVGSDGAVLGTARGSALMVRPGDAVGAQLSFTEQTQAEVKAATGVDYQALGVTFLGAQEIGGAEAVTGPVAVSSADFAGFVQPGQAVVNYRIAPDADGDGIGELVVVNTAAVAGDDVISDPVPALQLGAIGVTNQLGTTAVTTQQQGISGRPGDLVEIEASGFNPVSSASNRVTWTSLVDSSVVEGSATAAAAPGGMQLLTFAVPALPAGAATVTLENVSNGTSLAPISATIQAATLPAPAEDVIDQFLSDALAFVGGLPADSPESAAAKAAALQKLTSVQQQFTALAAELAANPNPDLEAVVENFALLVANSPLTTAGVIQLALTDRQKKDLNWLKYAAGVGAFGFGAYVTAVGAGCLATVACPIALGLGAAALAIEGYLLVEDERPGCPPLGGGGPSGGTTGMGSAPPAGGSGCGAASGGGSPSGSSLGTRQANGTILVKIFVGGQPLPFAGIADAAGYFYIPLIPAGEPFTAVATDTSTNETRTIDGIGPATGDSVYLFFDFGDDSTGLPTLTFDANTSSDLELDETEFYSFSGTAGQLVTLGCQGEAAFVEQAAVDLFGPGSSNDLAPFLSCSKFYDETGVLELPATGLYTVTVASQFSPSGFGSGSYTLGLSEIAPPTALDLSSSPATDGGDQTVLGDRQFFSFSGQAGARHKVTLALTGGSEFNGQVNVRGPGSEPFYDRPVLEDDFMQASKPVAVTLPLLLTETGEYILEIEKGNNGLAPGLGAWQLSVFTAPPPTAITIGDTITSEITLPGEMDLYTFTATAGQKVMFDTTIGQGVETDQVNWQLIAPNGSVLFDEPLFMDPGTFTLAEGGSYTLLIGADADPGTGGYEFTLQNAP